MKKVFNKLLSNSFVKGGLFLTIANVLVSFFNYLFSSLAAKKLGPVGFGEISTVFSYLTITAVFSGIINTLIIKKIGNETNNKGMVAKQIENWVYLKIKKWYFLIIVFFISIPFFSRLLNLSLFATFTVFSLIMLSFMNMIYLSILQGLHLFSFAATFGVIGAFIKLLAIPLIYFTNWDLPLLYVCIIFDFLLTLVLSVIYSRRFFSKKATTVLPKDKRIINILKTQENLIAFFSLFSFSFIGNIDIALSKKFFPDSQTGLYAAWALFSKIPIYIVAPFISTSFIFFTDQNRQKEHKKVMFFLIIILIVISLGIIILYHYFSNFLILLIFNHKYLFIEKYLIQAGIFGLFYMLVTIMNNYLIAKQNNLALISVLLTPIYFCSLILVNKNIENYININLLFIVSLTFLYFGAYVREVTKK